MNLYSRGNDLPFLITVKDNAGVAIDIDDLENIIISVYSNKNKVVLDKFSIVAKEGYNEITVENSAEGIVKIIIGHDKTINAELEEYVFEIRIEEADVEYPDGIKYTTSKGILGKFVDVKIKTLPAIS